MVWSKEELAEMIKIMTQEVMNNAEDLVGECQTLSGLSIEFVFKPDNVPFMRLTRSSLSDGVNEFLVRNEFPVTENSIVQFCYRCEHAGVPSYKNPCNECLYSYQLNKTPSSFSERREEE